MIIDKFKTKKKMNCASSAFSRKAVIVNDLGLHARSAAKIAAIAQTARSKVWIKMDGEKVDAKSVIDILTLGCGKGSEIVVVIDDRNDMNILESIKEMVDDGFGE
jgi:phosphocarrier protein